MTLALALRVCGLAALAGALAGSPAVAAEWWMVQQDGETKSCAPPLEAEGVTLTPDVLMKRFPECKLMDETPSLDLEAVMVNCEGDIGRVFVYTRSRAGCERLIAD
jgi:hypothetical protein